MKSLTSSQPNQPYSPVNRINLDMNFEELIFSQEYNYNQDYSMGHGSAHGSVPVNDDEEDDSHVEEVSVLRFIPLWSLVSVGTDTPYLPYWIRRWKDVEMSAFYNTQGRKKSKTSETTSGSASGGFNSNDEVDDVVDEAVEETQEFRPMGRDRAKAKKKAVGSSRGGSSSFVDLVADKFFNIKKIEKEGRSTTVLYRVEESGVEYPGIRGS
ncbi:hypothetical protein Tco_0360437 [Tanacetum coccineum]